MRGRETGEGKITTLALVLLTLSVPFASPQGMKVSDPWYVFTSGRKSKATTLGRQYRNWRAVLIKKWLSQFTRKFKSDKATVRIFRFSVRSRRDECEMRGRRRNEISFFIRGNSVEPEFRLYKTCFRSDECGNEKKLRIITFNNTLIN